ncbi:hypothetical protein ACWEU6_17810 [Streptosporangium sandarakinum]|uniref:hypothetical protein n=1 Tax=Streptosporangium sandarakinum TaxID=1260955 RepID=UPI003681B9D8
MRPLAAPVGATSAMLLVATSAAVPATIADHPVFTGQALRMFRIFMSRGRQQ